jgi:hypothetical protein
VRCQVQKKQRGPQRIAPRTAFASRALARQFGQKIASRMMIGSGMPISHNSKPRPNPIASSVWICR